jgi:aspartyl-tRNA(Asn)/glutamyl-tRNA(Gln) amidotransferase subunit C
MEITTQDIEHLARLARIEVTEDEKKSFQKDLNAIVGYVSEIQKVSDEMSAVEYTHKNIFRDDVVTNSAAEYTEAVLKNAPGRKDNYLKVDQVL